MLIFIAIIAIYVLFMFPWPYPCMLPNLFLNYGRLIHYVNVLWPDCHKLSAAYETLYCKNFAHHTTFQSTMHMLLLCFQQNYRYF